MAQTASKVSAGKPAVGGAIYVAVAGTTLPTSATAALTGFTSLGYVSEDGLTNANSPESTEIKAWGGDTVLTLQESKVDTFAFKLIEGINSDVLKFIYGDSNVTVATGGAITVKANASEAVSHAIVVDMILNGGYLKRICIPNGKISELGDIVYSDSEAFGYEATVTCFPDASSNTHYEYIQAPSTSGGGASA